MAEQKMTNVVGFFNAAKWPIQLVISKLNITLHLKSGEYVLDRNGRKINDPFFESYPQLKKEVSDAPVPLIIIPTVAPGGQAAQGNNPVRGTTKFEMSADGKRRPVMPLPAKTPEAQEATSMGTDPVRGMSIDEARRLGLVRRVREVPEDYGTNDNTGAPPRLPPTIKYSVDPSMLKKPKALPLELTKVDSKAANPAARTQLVSQLNQGALTEAAPTSASVFMNQATPNAPANALITSGPAMPHSVFRSRAPAAPVFNEPEQEPEPVEMTEAEQAAAESGVDLPVPDLTELSQEQQRPPEKENMQEVEEAAPPLPADLKQPAKRDRFICAGCGLPFKFYSQLDKHAQAKHKTTYAAIMAAYPQGQ